MSTHERRDGMLESGSLDGGPGGDLRMDDPLDRALAGRLDAMARGLTPAEAAMPAVFASAVRRRAWARRVPIMAGAGLATAAAIALAVVLMSNDAGSATPGVKSPGVVAGPERARDEEFDDPTLNNMNRATKLGKFEAATSGTSTPASAGPPVTAGARTLPGSDMPAKPR